jgi:SAM-dependent methyltransferase
MSEPQIYGDPAHYELLAQMTAPADLALYRDLYSEHGGPVLDLACGTGRIAIELAAEGADVEGVDLSRELIEHAASKAQARGLGLTLRQGDLRSFDCGRVFRLLVLAYNGFNHLLTLDDQRAFFERARLHMDAQSRLVIDTFQPSLVFLGNAPEKRRPILRYLDPYLQKEVVLHEEHHYEPATQIDTVRWFYTVAGVDEARTDEIRMRLFFPEELDALLAANGLVLEKKLGDYDRSPFGSSSPKQIVVCRKAE